MTAVSLVGEDHPEILTELVEVVHDMQMFPMDQWRRASLVSGVDTIAFPSARNSPSFQPWQAWTAGLLKTKAERFVFAR